MTDNCIAVATDFSGRADRAIDRALQLANDRNRKLCVLHALDDMDAENADWSALDRKMQASVGSAEKPGKLEFVYPEGSPPQAIADACKLRDAAMLLIGPARYNSIGDYFLGTSVDYVLRHTTLPVLVVKNRVRAPYDRIVAGTDFSDESAHAIAEAARIFPDAAIHVVHAWHVPFESWNSDAYVADETAEGEGGDMQAFLSKLAQREPRLSKASGELVRGSPVKAIRDALGDEPNSLVVLGSHGTSGWKQAMIGSVTSDLLRYVEADMLVIDTKDPVRK